MDKYTAEHTLELSGAYDAHSLKAAYHALAAKYHPDAAERHGFTKEEATSKMQDINEANDFLAKYVVSPTGTTICDESPVGSYAGPKPAPRRRTLLGRSIPSKGIDPGRQIDAIASEPRSITGPTRATKRARRTHGAAPSNVKKEKSPGITTANTSRSAKSRNPSRKKPRHTPSPSGTCRFGDSSPSSPTGSCSCS